MRTPPSLLLLLLLSALMPACRSKEGLRAVRPASDGRWAQVDSLMREGRFADALTVTDAVLADAETANDALLWFAAEMRRAHLRQLTGTDRLEVLQDLDRATDSLRAAEAPFPLVPLLHSALAEAWWGAYADDRWRVLERGHTAADPADPATWSQAVWMRHVLQHVHRSLEPWDSLRTWPVAGLVGLLRIWPDRDLGDTVALALRPTLLDLLGHRALDLLQNPETRLAEPVDAFRWDDPRHFAVFDAFAFGPFHHADSTAWGLEAMRLYQRLERAHLSDDRPDALVDLTLGRLAWVHGRSVRPDADTLYLAALNTLRSRVPDDTCWSEVTLAIARWHAERAEAYDPLVSDAFRDERRTAHALCREAMDRFPGSYGARNAEVLRADLERTELDLTTEEAAMPGRDLMMSLRYRNAARVRLRLVRDQEEPGRDRRWDQEHMKRLLGQHPLRSWTQDLPDDGDMNPHRTDLPVGALLPGRYAVLVSDREGFTAGKDLIAYAHVQVTRFALAERNRDHAEDIIVLDRWSGRPLPGVKVDLYGVRTAKDQPVKLGEAVTDAQGRPEPELRNVAGRQFITLEQGDDRWTMDAGYRWWDGDPALADSIRTVLFTDRAIYRPGQEVHVKGIVTVRRGDRTAVRAGHKGMLRLRDVNGDAVDSAAFTTDGFGSCPARFKAPEGVLTGVMRIEEAHGSAHVRVEEYKRPTFEVLFDTLAGSPRLDGPVELTGRAASYAGVPLDGAAVRWTVHRTARMPWWCGFGWRGLPWGRPVQVASGAAACDAQGRFTARFTAPSDPAFPRAADPVFRFTAEAVVTDRSGETQSGGTAFQLARRGTEIDLRAADALDRSTLDSLDVRVRNLNGMEVDVPLDIRIHRLQEPATPYRQRLLPRSDRTLLDRDAHAARFPEDAYGDEADPLSRPVAEQVFERLGHRAHGRALPLPGARSWDVGTYRIELHARGEGGDTMTVRTTVTLYDPRVEHTGFTEEAFHAQVVKDRCEPGEKAVLLLSTALPEVRVLMEVERGGLVAVERALTLHRGQQRVELPVRPDDRGGFAVHLLCVERGRAHAVTVPIDVPWTDKELQVEWMSFRDKLRPGDHEEWRLKLRGAKGQAVAAQLLATLYDASLDHFAPHDWAMDVHPRRGVLMGWTRTAPFGTDGGRQIWRNIPWPAGAVRLYPELETYGMGDRYGGYGRMDRVMMTAAAPALEEGERTGMAQARAEEKVTEDEQRPGGAPPPPPEAGPPAPRSDFRETAFFFPDLLTDRDGELVLRFTVPDALTRWNLLGLAHTKDLQLARLARSVRTVKPLMVVPALPRFLRAGDRMTLTAKVNLTEPGRAQGAAHLSLFDPETGAPLDKAFGLSAAEWDFNVAQGESAAVGWNITVPEGTGAVGVRITVTGRTAGPPRATASDGEEHVLPVLTDQVLVTERLALWSNGPGTRTFTMGKLHAPDTSRTRRDHLLRLEYTPNPAWLAVQALPYLMEAKRESAEEVFARYYANRLAAHVIAQHPEVGGVFAQWRGAGEDAFAGMLERNAGLKQALLAETPWAVEARDDRTRRRRLAVLLDPGRTAREADAALRTLQAMQMPEGAWPWWSGMAPNAWVTRRIVAGLGHLERLGAADLRNDGPAQMMLHKAVDQLDRAAARRHQELLRTLDKDALAKYRPGHDDLHGLYARSFFRRWAPGAATAAALRFLTDRARDGWLTYGLQDQALLAIVLHRADDREGALRILESLRQRASRSEELGMYWKSFRRGPDPWSFPVETYALLIEAFHEVAGDTASVNALRTHLLQLKRTTDWGTGSATAEACHALLLTAGEWLSEGEGPVVRVGGKPVLPEGREAGTGTYDRTWAAAEVRPAMGEVSITGTADRPSWGGLYWQYFERMDRVAPPDRDGAPSPLRIERQVMLERPGDHGPVLTELAGGATVRPGDKLTVRLVLRTDRPLDFVHVKDLRGSGLEPTETLSGPRYQDGIGYYQSVRDTGTDLFLDHLPPGTHVFSHGLRAVRPGDFSQGVATAECMYAPEFGDHSAGLRLKVSP